MLNSGWASYQRLKLDSQVQRFEGQLLTNEDSKGISWKHSQEWSIKADWGQQFIKKENQRSWG